MKKRRIIASDPAQGVTIISSSRYKEPIRIPTMSDFLEILRTADRLANSSNVQISSSWERYRAMIYLAADSGMRPQEYIALPPRGLHDNGVEIVQALECHRPT